LIEPLNLKKEGYRWGSVAQHADILEKSDVSVHTSGTTARRKGARQLVGRPGYYTIKMLRKDRKVRLLNRRRAKHSFKTLSPDDRKESRG